MFLHATPSSFLDRVVSRQRRAACWHAQLPHAGTSAHNCVAPVPQQQRGASSARRGPRGVACRAQPFDKLVYDETYVEVEELRGIRIVFEDDGETPVVQYLVKWKDGAADTWEPAKDLSEDLIRDYEEGWWTAARKGDAAKLAKMLSGGRAVLVHALDENRRSALHFAAGLGNLPCTQLLLDAGCNPNLLDREGFTPLHMAAGYCHTTTMSALLQAGADPTIRDRQGRDVVSLIDNLRRGMPLTMATVTRRLALEEVTNTLSQTLYEEVEPANILAARDAPLTPEEEAAAAAAAASSDGAAAAPARRRQFLVAFGDGRDDEWVDEDNVSPDIVDDWEAGLEYASVTRVVDIVQVGTERRFKVEWGDGYPTSWEPEEHLPPALVDLFRRENPQLFEEKTAAVTLAMKKTLSPDGYETQYTIEAAGGGEAADGGGNGTEGAAPGSNWDGAAGSGGGGSGSSREMAAAS